MWSGSSQQFAHSEGGGGGWCQGLSPDPPPHALRDHRRGTHFKSLILHPTFCHSTRPGSGAPLPQTLVQRAPRTHQCPSVYPPMPTDGPLHPRAGALLVLVPLGFCPPWVCVRPRLAAALCRFTRLSAAHAAGMLREGPTCPYPCPLSPTPVHGILPNCERRPRLHISRN